jgi:hypothetical protein
MAVALNPAGGPVRVGNVLLRTPGLEGSAEAHPPGSAGMRAAEQSTAALDQALADENVQTQETVELLRTREVAGAAPGLRSTAQGEPAIELQALDPGADWGQFVLASDEAGVLTWHYPVDEGGRTDLTRGGATRTYLIPRRVVPPAPEPGSRGLLGSLGKKVLKVLAFPILDPIIGAVGDYFAGRWEAKKRPYRLRRFTPEDYQGKASAPLEEGDWSRLAGGRGLLLIHGTGSRTHIAFGALPRDVVTGLHTRYGGRVFAFDHFTLSQDPMENVTWLVSALPERVRLDLDIICHSRGGLVARTLAEQAGQFAWGERQVRIRRVVFVAVPNAGTALTNADYMGDLVDSYTNLLNFFPDNGVQEVFEAVITVAKQLAVATLKGLDGLQAMLPGGKFLAELNHGDKDDKRYFALAADYRPSDPGLKEYVATRLMGRIFQASNDLVVPTTGVFDKNGSAFFPVEDRHVFTGTDGVHHGNFFGNSVVHAKLAEWLAV